MNGLKKFDAEFPGQRAKIESDANIPTSVQHAFITYLENWNGVGNIGDYAEEFFRRYQQLGPDANFATTECAGHVRKKIAVLSHLHGYFGLPTREAEALLGDWIAMPESRRLTEVRAVLGSEPISPYVMWSFRNPRNKKDPLKSVALSLLPCRLGLTMDEPHLHLFFAYPLSPPVTARIPTALDPGIRNISNWQPGGTTKPNKKCQNQYRTGLPEIVHDPVQFRSLTAFKVAT